MACRVCFLGNMNNNHFAMVRYLRDRGIDAYLLLFDDDVLHFSPFADSYTRDYMAYTRKLTWGSARKYINTTRTQIQKDLSSYDYIVGCGYAPAYCAKAKIILDVFIPYGGDIWILTSHKIVSMHNMLTYFMAVECQKKGIKKCKIWHMDNANEIYERQFRKLKGECVRWYDGIPMLYHNQYVENDLDYMISRSHWGSDFVNIRRDNDLVVMSHMRHVWGKEGDPESKGNNRLVEGWSIFCKKNKNLKCKLILLEYGKDVEKTKELITKLNLVDKIEWFPLMYRKDVMVGLKCSDVVCGEFVNSWYSSGIIYEGLVSEKPLLFFREENHKKACEQFPILNARYPQEISDRLEEFVQDREKWQCVGRKGVKWYEQNVVQAGLKHYLNLFK